MTDDPSRDETSDPDPVMEINLTTAELFLADIERLRDERSTAELARDRALTYLRRRQDKLRAERKRRPR